MQQTDLPATDALTLHMEGLEEDDGDMRISVFLDKIDALRMALQELDKQLGGIDQPTLDYVVSDLSHSSPAAITLSPSAAAGLAAHQQNVFSTFCTILEAARTGVLRDLRVGHEILTKILKLAEGSGNRFKTMWISRQGKVVTAITEETAAAVQELLAKEIHALGSVKGRVERYNSHNKEMHFYLYPALGDRVRCVFREEMRENASTAVEQTVVVNGMLSYWEGSFYPHQVAVAEIEILAKNDELATLSSLGGAAPDATGNQSAVDFLRSHRDGWH